MHLARDRDGCRSMITQVQVDVGRWGGRVLPTALRPKGTAKGAPTTDSPCPAGDARWSYSRLVELRPEHDDTEGDIPGGTTGSGEQMNSGRGRGVMSVPVSAIFAALFTPSLHQTPEWIERRGENSNPLTT
ncbi:uncharacterized protein LOC123507610 [Portunus trituberculatus]|uniref:uncharacterized protein LOC123507610 n=1 Tax=Portunus trituberculatus TaxID=210409 RepID=UPI001E1CC5CD|nr:uncharacterized protein LOC123507610 [Portunus trituberculatus]